MVSCHPILFSNMVEQLLTSCRCSPLSIEQIEDLYHLQHSRTVTKATAQDVLEIVLQNPTQTPSDVSCTDQELNGIRKKNKIFSFQIVDENDLRQINDVEIIRKICQDAVDQNPKLVKLFKKGKQTKLRNVIKEASKKRANPIIVSQVLDEIVK